MTDSTPLPSRRAQREAREAAERSMSSPTSAYTPVTTPGGSTVTELPSRRSLRQNSVAVAPSQNPDVSLDQWVVPTSTVGQNTGAVATLHIEQFPTGEISGPIDHTGEIILTGPITIPALATEKPVAAPIIATLDGEAPGIPRRATEALSIIGRAGPIDEKARIPSVGQGISAGFATFLGLLVVLLIGLAFYTNLI